MLNNSLLAVGENKLKAEKFFGNIDLPSGLLVTWCFFHYVYTLATLLAYCWVTFPLKYRFGCEHCTTDRQHLCSCWATRTHYTDFYIVQQSLLSLFPLRQRPLETHMIPYWSPIIYSYSDTSKIYFFTGFFDLKKPLKHLYYFFRKYLASEWKNCFEERFLRFLRMQKCKKF